MASFYAPLKSFLSKFIKKKPDPVHPLRTLDIDTEKITAKYQAERAKRLREDGVHQFKLVQDVNSHLNEDTYAPPLIHDPIEEETKVLICGAGFAGLVTSVKLKEQGVEDFVVLDKGADWGGTWYWNQYPGVACDVESFIYLPFLEETGHVPTKRFVMGPEIREQIQRVVDKWDLAPKARLQTRITSMIWDESIRRWHVRTNHNDHFITQFIVLATGTFHEPKLPALAGIDNFERDHFHSGRWNYDITGGDGNGNMTKLADKTVGIIGTGASAVQLVPQLAKDAKKLYVFQRTPSSITIRDNYPIEPSISSTFKPGWQRERMRVFASILQGDVTHDECTALEGLEPLTVRALANEAQAAGAPFSPEQIPELLQLADFRLMDSIRSHISSTVTNPGTAASLQPWYSFMCKRPAFHNDYLASFNRPNVELIDTDGKGVDHLTATAVVANGTPYPVDLLIYSTGFDFEAESDFARRTGIELIGTQGRSLDESWRARGGPSTLFGLHMREFPNLFNIGPVQAGVTANWTHTTYVAGEHIAAVVAEVFKRGQELQVIEPTLEAEEEWGRQTEEGSAMRLAFAKSCPPGYYNREGKPEEMSARWGYYPKGIAVWTETMREWREEGGMRGMEKR